MPQIRDSALTDAIPLAKFCVTAAVLRGLGHTLGNNAVVGAEDQHRFFAWGRHGIFADAGKLYDHIFQPSQTMQRLCNGVPVQTGAFHGIFIQRPYGF